LAIAVSLLLTVATGIALDRGRSVGVAASGAVSVACAVAGRERAGRWSSHRADDLIEDAHEAFANFLMLVVGVHVAYLLTFKRPIALFMMFVEPRRRLDRP